MNYQYTYNLNTSQEHDAEWEKKKPISKGNILYDFTYLTFPKVTEMENRLMIAKV